MFPIRPAGQLGDERTWVVPIGAPGPLSHPGGELAAETAVPAGGFGAVEGDEPPPAGGQRLTAVNSPAPDGITAGIHSSASRTLRTVSRMVSVSSGTSERSLTSWMRPMP